MGTTLYAVLNIFWKVHPTEQQLYGHLLLISQTLQVRRTRHARHCWGRKDELISDIFLWNPTHGHTSVNWSTKIYSYQLFIDQSCRVKDLTYATTDRDGWWVRAKGLREVKISGNNQTFISKLIFPTTHTCVCVCVCLCACVCVGVCVSSQNSVDTESKSLDDRQFLA